MDQVFEGLCWAQPLLALACPTLACPVRSVHTARLPPDLTCNLSTSSVASFSTPIPSIQLFLHSLESEPPF